MEPITSPGDAIQLYEDICNNIACNFCIQIHMSPSDVEELKNNPNISQNAFIEESGMYWDGPIGTIFHCADYYHDFQDILYAVANNIAPDVYFSYYEAMEREEVLTLEDYATQYVFECMKKIPRNK